MVEKNSKKTPREYYNCGGYALRTYTWFYPYACLGEDHSDEELKAEEELYEEVHNFWDNCCDDTDTDAIWNYFAKKLVDNMIIAFKGKMRQAKNTKDVKFNERLVAFRFGDGDFHYMIKGRIGHQWHSKMGGSRHIDTYSEDFVMNSEDWNDCYYSDTFLLAVKTI